MCVAALRNFLKGRDNFMHAEIILSNEQVKEIAYDWYDVIVKAITEMRGGENSEEK